MRQIVERMSGGWLKIHTPAYNDQTREKNYPGDTDDALIQRVINRHEISDYFIIDDATPAVDAFLRNRDFRDAWEAPTDELAVNMAKARAIHLAEIRRVRNEEVAKEDINLMIANESGTSSEQDAVKAKKQTLRDLPATFDITTGVDTPVKLKAKWPSELPARE